MTDKPAFSSAAALVMAQAQKQLADKYDDADLALNAIKLERRAQEAIKLHLPELPVEKSAGNARPRDSQFGEYPPED
jgi:hypothetical protein